jgi:hypothetical protein
MLEEDDDLEAELAKLEHADKKVAELIGTPKH